MEKELKEGEQDEAQDEPMEEEEVIETVEIDQTDNSRLPRRSTRPSALKLYGITELSEAFGIPLDTDSESDDQEFAPTKETLSGSASSDTSVSRDDSEEEESNKSPITTQDLLRAVSDDLPAFEDIPSLSNHNGPDYCSVCLETSKGNDIVTCDMCGLTVHEGCYGVPEDVTDSDVKSEGSSVSTVPWFCDSCKAGIERPLCELCPNRGGVFKQTVNGCWVHVVCCLYISGIEYIEPNILSGVTLDSIPPVKWGAKPCSLCENEWDRITGVCISCDAGLCKNHFHVTCAQNAGLLCEVDEPGSSKDGEEVPDAYFAHCWTHCNKQQAKKKSKKFKEIQQRVRRRSQVNDSLSRHLSDAKTEYTKLLHKMRKWYRPEELKRKRQPRWLHSNPSAFHLLTEKAKALGYSSKQAPQALRNRSGIVSVGLNIEFVTFFNERTGQIKQLEGQIRELRPTVEKLQLELKQKEELKSQKEADLKCLKLKSSELIQSTKSLLEKVNKVVGKEALSIDSITSSVNIPLDLSTSQIDNDVHTVRCCVCKGTEDNHLIIECDTCKDCYHIHCLDPPLTKVPKKSSKFGWQCEECCHDSEDDLKPQEVSKDEPQSKFGRRIRKRGIDWETQMMVFN